MYKTRRLIRDSILFTRTASSKRGLTWEFRDSILGVHRGVVVAIDALYILFRLRSFFFGDGCVTQELMHFCPLGIPMWWAQEAC